MLQRVLTVWGVASAVAFGSPVANAASSGQDNSAEQLEVDELKEARQLARDGDLQAARYLLEGYNNKQLANDSVRSEQQKILGNLYNKLGRYDEAIASFSNVISFPDDNKEFALINRCYSFLQLNLIVDAKRDCAEARFFLSRESSNSTELQLHWLISLGQVEANVLLREGNLSEALMSITKAADAVREYSTGLSTEQRREEKPYLVYLNTLIDEIQILGENKEFDQAISRARELLDRARVDFPERVSEVLAEEAALHGLQRQFEQAGGIYYAAYNNALQNPLNDRSSEQLKRLLFLSCMSYLRSGETSETLRTCLELYNSETDNPNFLEFYGLSLVQAQRNAEAIDVFRRILSMTAEDQARFKRMVRRIDRLSTETLD